LEVRAGERLAFDVDSMKCLDDPVVVVYTSDGQLVASADDRLQQNGSHPNASDVDPGDVERGSQGRGFEGLPGARVEVCGEIKYDTEIKAAFRSQPLSG
jgi:hypothetical protein